jgi:phosphotransferase system HPr-like phosphotransfer protein
VRPASKLVAALAGFNANLVLEKNGKCVTPDSLNQIALLQVRRHDKLRLLARKASIAQEIEAFMDLSAAEYGVQYGGTKGNVTLTSFDGRFQVVRAIGEHRKFDERLQTAKTLIDACIGRWSEGSSNEIRALVDHAFRVNKGGHVDVNQVLSLRKLEIQDVEWKEAMKAIADAITVVGKAEYIRFYEKTDTGAYKAIVIDWSKL